MELLYTATVIATVTITITLFIALHRQTRRADRAEAALARVEAEIARTTLNPMLVAAGEA
ncbi:hypothetical protein [Sphingomonas xinjiangensis]|uniref:Uncharacterized protein n=1 Tax=Sphingomonas xinjiangensis TaxID=643568 RepID=A0A840YKS5_9SPHN|nr:hypothetical protein [Sphingomonas xinjiangensis]MBB5709690.1 hypothetical protein [Sphingomonas xinjiangensis]